MDDDALWRPMRPDDLSAVVRIADIVHPDLPEPPEVFADRLLLWPQGAFVLEVAGTVAGYAIGHPIRYPEPPRLGSLLGSLPGDADGFYVHDVALLPEMRGRSLAGTVVQRLLASAPNLRPACLISVYDTSRFWQRHGFTVALRVIALEKLASYGPGAVFMVLEGAGPRRVV